MITPRFSLPQRHLVGLAASLLATLLIPTAASAQRLDAGPWAPVNTADLLNNAIDARSGRVPAGWLAENTKPESLPVVRARSAVRQSALIGAIVGGSIGVVFGALASGSCERDSPAWCGPGAIAAGAIGGGLLGLGIGAVIGMIAR